MVTWAHLGTWAGMKLKLKAGASPKCSPNLALGLWLAEPKTLGIVDTSSF
jgi:hypothetical protein